MGKLIWDDEFTVKPVENQRALIDLCNYLKDESDLVRNNRVTCWILDMQAMVEKDSTCSNGQLMPFADESDFNRCLWTFMKSRTGQDYQRSQTLVYDYENRRIKYMRISAQSIGE